MINTSTVRSLLSDLEQLFATTIENRRKIINDGAARVQRVTTQDIVTSHYPANTRRVVTYLEDLFEQTRVLAGGLRQAIDDEFTNLVATAQNAIGDERRKESLSDSYTRYQQALAAWAVQVPLMNADQLTAAITAATDDGRAADASALATLIPLHNKPLVAGSELAKAIDRANDETKSKALRAAEDDLAMIQGAQARLGQFRFYLNRRLEVVCNMDINMPTVSDYSMGNYNPAYIFGEQKYPNDSFTGYAAAGQ